MICDIDGAAGHHVHKADVCFATRRKGRKGVLQISCTQLFHTLTLSCTNPVTRKEADASNPPTTILRRGLKDPLQAMCLRQGDDLRSEGIYDDLE